MQPRVVTRCVNRSGIGGRLGICVRTTGTHDRTLSRILLCKPPKLKGAALTVIVTGRLSIQVRDADKPTVRQPNSLVMLLGRLRTKSILFVSRVRHLPQVIRRILCSTVRSCCISVVVKRKPATRPIRFALPPFALINTAAGTNDLSTPLHSQFNVISQVRCCDLRSLQRVIRHSSSILSAGVSRSNTIRVTLESENAPHITGQLLQHIHSFTRICHSKLVAGRVTSGTLSVLDISGGKLSSLSERVLAAVVHFCGNNPINLSAVTTGVNRRVRAVRSVCRPCLLRLNFLRHAPHNEMTAPVTCSRLKVSCSARGWIECFVGRSG